MTPKILRPCDVCKRYHASYLVTDTSGRLRRLCYDCWKALESTGKGVAPESETGAKGDEGSEQNPLSPVESG